MHRLHLAARARIATLALIAGLVLLPGLPAAALQAQTAAPQVRITEYPLPTPDSAPGGLTVGPDGALWFTENDANKIGRLALVTAPGLPNTGGGATRVQPSPPIVPLAALALVAILAAIAHRTALRHRSG